VIYSLCAFPTINQIEDQREEEEEEVGRVKTKIVTTL